MSRFLLCCTLPVLVLGFAAHLTTQTARAQGNDGVNLTYVTEDAVVAAVAFPRQVFLSDEGEMLPREIVTAAVQNEMGFDPISIDRVIAFGNFDPTMSQPRFGIVLEFIDDPKLEDWTIPGLVEGELLGKPIRQDQFGEAALMQVDENTVLVGDLETLKSMLSEKKNDSPLRTLIAQSSEIDDVNLFVAVEPIREIIKNGLLFVPLEGPFEDVAELPDLIDSISLHSNLGLLMQLKLHINSSDEATASKVKDILTQTIATGRQLAVGMMEMEMGATEDPIERATLQYANRVSERIAEMISPTQEGSRLTMTMEDELATTGTLVALLLPAVQAAREAARRTQSMNNLKQIALAMHIHADVHGTFPARAITNDEGEPLLSWRVALLPYLEQEELYEQFHLDEPWDSEHNRALIEKMPLAFANPNLAEQGMTNYLLPYGEGTTYENDDAFRIRDITDGTSNTIMAVEADAREAVIWTKPDDLEYNSALPLNGLGGLRAGGFLASLWDGSVHFISNTVDLDSLRGMMTHAGGEIVDVR